MREEAWVFRPGFFFGTSPRGPKLFFLLQNPTDPSRLVAGGAFDRDDRDVRQEKKYGDAG